MIHVKAKILENEEFEKTKLIEMYKSSSIVEDITKKPLI